MYHTGKRATNPYFYEASQRDQVITASKFFFEENSYETALQLWPQETKCFRPGGNDKCFYASMTSC